MDFWVWLKSNSVELQSLVALVGTFLSIITIIVLSITWNAIKRQADAARALQHAAVEQTAAAVDAAASAKRQAELLMSQLELSSAPLLVSESRPGPIKVIVNRGQGVAFDVKYWEGDKDECKTIWRPQITTLAPACESALRFNGYPEMWTISYKGIDGQERWTTSYNGYEKPQEHYVTRGGQIYKLA